MGAEIRTFVGGIQAAGLGPGLVHWLVHRLAGALMIRGKNKHMSPMNELVDMSSELCKIGSSLTQRVRPSMDLWMQPLSIRVRRSRGGYKYRFKLLYGPNRNV